MSRASRRAGIEMTLEGLEVDFRRILIDALHRCSNGLWGLFGQNDNALASLSRPERKRLASSDASNLIDLGNEINELRIRLGLPPYALYQRFLEYRRCRGANVPGEPHLARKML